MLVAIGTVYERVDMSVDISTGYALLNLVGSLAIAKYLENARSPSRKVNELDIYVGLSAGSILASSLAAGITPGEMIQVLDGTSTRLLTNREFQQIAGRAGRRGFDEHLERHGRLQVGGVRGSGDFLAGEGVEVPGQRRVQRQDVTGRDQQRVHIQFNDFRVIRNQVGQTHQHLDQAVDVHTATTTMPLQQRPGT